MSIGELLVILIVALVVIKPERLPEIAYLIGRFVANCKAWYHQIFEKYNQLM